MTTLRGFVSRLSDFLDKEGLTVSLPEAHEKALTELHQRYTKARMN